MVQQLITDAGCRAEKIAKKNRLYWSCLEIQVSTIVMTKFFNKTVDKMFVSLYIHVNIYSCTYNLNYSR